MDKIYLTCGENNIIFLDCTRLNGEKNLVSRINPNNSDSVINQIKLISDNLKRMNLNKIVLADDVVFSGAVLRMIIKYFNNNGIEVIGIRSCISTEESFDYFNAKLPLGLKCGCLLEKGVIDQICERDFYLGIVQSGISVRDKSGVISKSPYFKPYGNPIERASIPVEYEKSFSLGCIKRSIILWEEIERLSSRRILVNELPEKINLLEENEEVVKVLKKGRWNI